MADLGTAYVQIVASAEGITGSVTEVLDPEAAKAGKSAAGKITKNLSSGITKAGAALTAGVTVPLMAIGAASVSAFKEVHVGLENIITKTGASGAALDDMKQVMKGVASEVPASFDEIGNSIGEVNTRFGVTGDELQDLSARFIKFAKLNGTDVTGSIDAVQKAMAAFGMETSETGDMLDILNKVGQKTGANVDSLARSMVTNSAALHEMGFNASQSAQFLGELEVSGIDATQMMTGLKKALTNAAKEGKPLNQALSEVQDSIMNASSSTEAMTIATELFGAKAGPAIAEACRTGVINFNDLGSAVEGYGDSVESTFERTQTPFDRFEIQMNRLKILGSEVGERLLEVLEPVIDKLILGLEKLIDAWDRLSPEMQTTIVMVGLLIAAIGPLMLIGGAIMSIITMLSGAVGILGAAFTFLLSPIGMVVIAIGLIIAAGLYLRAHWEELGPILKGIWDGIKETASTVWNAMKMVILSPVMAAVSFIKSHWEAAKAFLSGAWNAIKATASAAWSAIKTTISTHILAAKAKIGTTINNIKTTVSNVFNSIKSTATTVWNAIKNAMTKPIEQAKTTITNIINKIKSMFPISIGNIFSNIRLPKIEVTWSAGFGGIKIPSFHVSWHRSAYDTPLLFNSPTIVPTLSGLHGFGDGPGGEIVYGRNQLMRDIALASGGSGNITINIYGAEGQSPRAIAEEVKKILVRQENNRRAAWT